MRYEKWNGPKVCWKFNDPPWYDTRCILKNSVHVFSMYLFWDKHVATCLPATFIVQIYWWKTPSATSKVLNKAVARARNYYKGYGERYNKNKAREIQTSLENIKLTDCAANMRDHRNLSALYWDQSAVNSSLQMFIGASSNPHR